MSRRPDSFTTDQLEALPGWLAQARRVTRRGPETEHLQRAVQFIGEAISELKAADTPCAERIQRDREALQGDWSCNASATGDLSGERRALGRILFNVRRRIIAVADDPSGEAPLFCNIPYPHENAPTEDEHRRTSRVFLRLLDRVGVSRGLAARVGTLPFDEQGFTEAIDEMRSGPRARQEAPEDAKRSEQRRDRRKADRAVAPHTQAADNAVDALDGAARQLLATYDPGDAHDPAYRKLLRIATRPASAIELDKRLGARNRLITGISDD